MNNCFSNPKDRLRILFTHRTRGKGVEGVHIRGIFNAFKQLGHEVKIVGPPAVNVGSRVSLEKKSERPPSSCWDFISEHAPQLFFELAELFYNLYIYPKLMREISKGRVDFIYERYALNTFSTVLFGKQYGIPVILEVNDATGIQRVRDHKAEFIARYIERWVFNNSAALVTISSEFQRILWQRVTDKDKVTYVPNAIDPLIFDPNRYDMTKRVELGLEGKIVVGFVGSFANWHGIDLLLDVIPPVVKNNSDVRFLFVGSGVSLPRFKRKVEKMGLTSSVVFTGKVPFGSIPQYLKSMDVGVIPHSNTYGSPMKLFEYMAMKVVPVVPDLPPMLDVIKNGVTGMIFKAKSAESLAAQLIRICTDNVLRSRLAENARRQVLAKHLWIHNAKHILKVYQRILENEE